MTKVDTSMDVGGAQGDEERPACFNGLWWMQGNPASDDVASFYGSEWQSMEGKKGWPKPFKKAHSKKEAKDAATEVEGAGSETELKYVMQVRVANPNVWTWHSDFKGKTGFKAVRAEKEEGSE